MPDEEIIIPEEQQNADPVAEEVEKVKHALAEAQQFAFSKMTERRYKRKNDNSEDPPVGDAPAEDAPPPKESAFDRELSITREARMLEDSGIPFAVASRISEAIRAGDYDAAGKYLDIHQNNETARNLEQIKEEDEYSKMRKYFGLRPASKKPTETEDDKLRRIFGLR